MRSIGRRTILFGCHRMGSLILKEFEKDKEDLLIVDYNPEIIKSLMEKKVPCIYGDFMHEEILEKINLKSAEIVVSSIPDFEDNMLLIRKTKKINKNAVVIVVASRISEARELYKQGADYVVLPKLIGGERATELVKMAKKHKGSLSSVRKAHLKHLNKVHHLLY